MSFLNIFRDARRQNSISNARKADRNRARLNLEALEGRVVLSTFTVSNFNDAGAGSLRQAILSADTDTTASVINFSATFNNRTVTPSTALPLLNNPKGITINGPTVTLALQNSKTVDSNDTGHVNGTQAGLAVTNGSTATLNGLILRNSAARGVSNDGTLVLNTVKIVGSQNGAAVNTGTMTINDSILINNTAINYGGGVDNFGGNLAIHHTQVVGNLAHFGGGVDSSAGTVVIDQGSIFQNNGGPAGNDGGGLYIENGSTVKVDASTFQGNFAGVGGAIHNNGGNLTVTNTTFTLNHADDGGAIDDDGATPTVITSDKFTNNTSNAGSAIFVDGPALKLTNNDIFGNFGNHGDVDGALDPTSSNNVIGSGSHLSGIVDNSPGEISYDKTKPTNFLGTDNSLIAPIMTQSTDSGAFQGLAYRYTYNIRTNVATLNISAGTAKHAFNITSVTPNLSPGDPNPYPSNNYVIGLQINQTDGGGNNDGPSIALWQGYTTNVLKHPTLTVTSSVTAGGSTFTNLITGLNYTYNGKKITAN